LYRTLPSFNEYLVIEQSKPYVRRFYRQGGIWSLDFCGSLEDTLHLMLHGLAWHSRSWQQPVLHQLAQQGKPSALR